VVRVRVRVRVLLHLAGPRQGQQMRAVRHGGPQNWAGREEFWSSSSSSSQADQAHDVKRRHGLGPAAARSLAVAGDNAGGSSLGLAAPAADGDVAEGPAFCPVPAAGLAEVAGLGEVVVVVVAELGVGGVASRAPEVLLLLLLLLLLGVGGGGGRRGGGLRPGGGGRIRGGEARDGDLPLLHNSTKKFLNHLLKSNTKEEG